MLTAKETRKLAKLARKIFDYSNPLGEMEQLEFDRLCAIRDSAPVSVKAHTSAFRAAKQARAHARQATLEQTPNRPDLMTNPVGQPGSKERIEALTVMAEREAPLTTITDEELADTLAHEFGKWLWRNPDYTECFHAHWRQTYNQSEE